MPPLQFWGSMVLSGQKVSVDVCCAAFVRNTDVFCGRQVLRPLYDLMSANKPDDIDLLFMGKAPHTRFAPKSMAGQAGHHSD